MPSKLAEIYYCSISEQEEPLVIHVICATASHFYVDVCSSHFCNWLLSTPIHPHENKNLRF